MTRETKQRQNNLITTLCREIVTLLSFFGILVNLEQSGGWIPDRESAKVMFLLIATFCPKKPEKRTKKSLTQLSHYFLE